MLHPMLTHQRDELLGQLTPGKGHSEGFRRAIAGCFDLADTARSRREDIATDRALSPAERKTAAARMADDDLLPHLVSLTAPVREVKARVDAERGKYRDGSLPAELSALREDVGRAEAAIYFARREIEPASALSTAHFNAILTGNTW